MNLAELEAHARYHLAKGEAVLVEPGTLLGLVTEIRSRREQLDPESVRHWDTMREERDDARVEVTRARAQLAELTLDLNGVARLVGHPTEGLTIVDMVSDAVETGAMGVSPEAMAGRAEIAKLRAALGPFAAQARRFEPRTDPPPMVADAPEPDATDLATMGLDECGVTVGDLRRAREVLK